jgi:glycine/D-amino acid oxidase-like deaminating enzyme
MERYDVIIVGGGIAGASAGFALAVPFELAREANFVTSCSRSKGKNAPFGGLFGWRTEDRNC